MGAQSKESEANLMRGIMLRLSSHGTIVRYNAGDFRTKDGRYIRSTIPKGHSDLVLYRKPDGKACFVEAKVKPNKPTAEQQHFIEQMIRGGCNAGVAYSVEDAVKICGVGGIRALGGGRLEKAHWRAAYDFYERHRRPKTSKDWHQIAKDVSQICTYYENNESLASFIAAIVGIIEAENRQ